MTGESLKNIGQMVTQGDAMALLLPELLMIVSIVMLIILGIFVEGKRRNALLGLLSLGVCGLATILTIAQAANTSGAVSLFSEHLVIDRLGLFFKALALGTTTIVIVMSLIYGPLNAYARLEYYAILLTGTLGAMLVTCSSNWLMLYLGLETLSMASYVLTGYIKADSRSAEGSIKYLIYGAAASAFLLFGISYLFGLTGTLRIDAALDPMGGSLIRQMALLMVFIGIGFKMAAVPFHFWAPDVYQGAPTPITAYLAVASKSCGFIAAIRVFLPGLTQGVEGTLATVGWEPFFWAVSILTMTAGNLAALRQSSLKRMLAYSSIAHAGYLMMALAVPGQQALEALLFYLVAYLFMNLGAFLVVVYLEALSGTDETPAFQGLIRRQPMIVVILALLLFSLTGLPPTVGFIGKLLIFGSVIRAALDMPDLAVFYYVLALAGAINTAVSLYYYMNVLRVMVLQEKDEEASPLAKSQPAVTRGTRLTAAWGTGILGAATLVLGIFWGGLREIVHAVITS